MVARQQGRTTPIPDCVWLRGTTGSASDAASAPLAATVNDCMATNSMLAVVAILYASTTTIRRPRDHRDFGSSDIMMISLSFCQVTPQHVAQ